MYLFFLLIVRSVILDVFDVFPHVSDRSRQSSVSDEHTLQMHKSESLLSQHSKAQKLRFVPSVEYKHSSGNSAFIWKIKT